MKGLEISVGASRKSSGRYKTAIVQLLENNAQNIAHADGENKVDWKKKLSKTSYLTQEPMINRMMTNGIC